MKTDKMSLSWKITCKIEEFNEENTVENNDEDIDDIKPDLDNNLDKSDEESDDSATQGNLLMGIDNQNCSDLLWEKIVQVIEKNFWNSRLKAENLQKFWDH